MYLGGGNMETHVAVYEEPHFNGGGGQNILRGPWPP